LVILDFLYWLLFAKRRQGMRDDAKIPAAESDAGDLIAYLKLKDSKSVIGSREQNTWSKYASH